MMPRRRRIDVCASSVAALIGRHRFQPQSQAIERLSCQILGGDVRATVAQQATATVCDSGIVAAAVAMGLPGVKAKVEAIQGMKDAAIKRARDELAVASPTIPEVVREGEFVSRVAVANACATASIARIGCSDDVRKRVNARADELSLRAGAGDADAQRVIAMCNLPNHFVAQKMRMAVGTLSEADILSTIARREAFKGCAKPGAVSRVFLGSVDGLDIIVDVFLAGRADAITASGDVVEIKRRASRLFHRVVDYELVQMLCYMKLYDSQAAHLVEAYADEIDVHTVRNTGFEPIWGAIQSAIRDAVGLPVENGQPT